MYFFCYSVAKAINKCDLLTLIIFFENLCKQSVEMKNNSLKGINCTHTIETLKMPEVFLSVNKSLIIIIKMTHFNLLHFRGKYSSY